MKVPIGPPTHQLRGAQKDIARSDVRECCPQANPCAGGEPARCDLVRDDFLVGLMSPAEKALLLGVREDSMIPLPEGSSCLAEQTLKRLEHLIQLVMVSYARKMNWYRTWWITGKGRRMVQAIGPWPHASSASDVGVAKPSQAHPPVTSMP